MTTLLLDLRYALRTALKRPSTSAVIVLTLALGLGANAAIFAVVDALVLRPFAFPDIGRLAVVSETSPENPEGRQQNVAPANFLDWKKEASAFEQLGAMGWWDVNLTAAEDPQRVAGFFVSANFFQILGVQPALGRLLLPADEIRGQHRRAVLSDALWQRRYGSDPSVVGRMIQIDGESFEVVGVAASGFNFPMGAEIWAPLSMTAETAADRSNRYLTVIGRLAPGRSIEQAKAEMAVVADRLAREHPDANKDRNARVQTLAVGMQGEGNRPILLLWQASAIFVLLIACANIANLLLARGAERHRDFAVRLALGAGRGRLVRQLLSESTLPALVAIPLALVVADVGLHFLRVSMPARIIRFIPGWSNMSVDGRAFIFTALLALTAALVFGVLPALQVSGPRVSDALKDGGRGSTSGRQHLRRALVVVEIALALPLLVAAALSTAGANRFLNGPQGYDPEGILSMHAALPDSRYAEPEPRRRAVTDIVERLSGPARSSSGGCDQRDPSGTNNSSRPIEIEGRPNADPANPPIVDDRSVTPTYFSTLRIPILRGRELSTADRADTANVALVSQSLAERYFPGTDPVANDSAWAKAHG